MPIEASGAGDGSWDGAFPHVLWRAQNAVHRCLQQSIDDLGITVTQLGLAVHLQELGPLSAADLSRGFRISPQSVGTALAQLDRQGWVDRRPHPVHRKVVLFELSATGAEGVAAGRRRVAEATERVTGPLRPNQVRTLIGQLHDIVVAIDGPDRPVEPLWPVGG